MAEDTPSVSPQAKLESLYKSNLPLKEIQKQSGPVLVDLALERFYNMIGTYGAARAVAYRAGRAIGALSESAKGSVVGAATRTSETVTGTIDRVKEIPGQIKEAIDTKREALINKAVDAKNSFKNRMKEIKEAGRITRENAINSFFDKVNDLRKSFTERKDKIVDKANKIGTKSAKAVARMADTVVMGVETGIGLGVAGAKGGYHLAEKAVRGALRETLPLPHELAKGARDGWAEIMDVIAKKASESRDNSKAFSRGHRSKANAVRKSWS